MEGTVWLNGRILPPGEAGVSALDHGYLYGAGCFETVRVYGGRPFRLHRHVQRLLTGAATLGLPDVPTAHRVTAAVEEAVRAAGLQDARVRFSLTPGPGEPVPDGRVHGPPALLVIVLPHAKPGPSGISLVRSPWTFSSRSPLAGVKATAYAPYLAARREARARGADDALLVNERGEVVETSTSNVFLVLGGRLVTPDLDAGALPGVTREAILELARGLGIAADERPVPYEELEAVGEMFVSSSIIEIVPVTGLDGRPLAPGPLTRRLAAEYGALVRRETGR